MILLVEYNRVRGIVAYEHFDDADMNHAVTRRRELERNADKNSEVVLLTGPDIEAIREAYGRYFTGANTIL